MFFSITSFARHPCGKFLCGQGIVIRVEEDYRGTFPFWVDTAGMREKTPSAAWNGRYFEVGRVAPTPRRAPHPPLVVYKGVDPREILAVDPDVIVLGMPIDEAAREMGEHFGLLSRLVFRAADARDLIHRRSKKAADRHRVVVSSRLVREKMPEAVSEIKVQQMTGCRLGGSAVDIARKILGPLSGARFPRVEINKPMLLPATPGVHGPGTIIDMDSAYPSVVVRYQMLLPTLRNPALYHRVMARLLESKRRTEEPEERYKQKILMNSLYGVVLMREGEFYCPEVGQRIFNTVEDIQKRAAAAAKRHGLEVPYGNTDSIICVGGDDAVQRTLDEVNAEHPVTIWAREEVFGRLVVVKGGYALWDRAGRLLKVVGGQDREETIAQLRAGDPTADLTNMARKVMAFMEKCGECGRWHYPLRGQLKCVGCT